MPGLFTRASMPALLTTESGTHLAAGCRGPFHLSTTWGRHAPKSETETVPASLLYMRTSLAMPRASTGRNASSAASGHARLDRADHGVSADRQSRTAYPSPGAPRERRQAICSGAAYGMTFKPVGGAEHQPDSATYDCRTCAQKWPCPPAREYLLATTPDSGQLGMRLWDELEAAAGVLADEPPGRLFERFLRWTR